MKATVSRETFLIESLENVVDGIARTFGSRCEVVLHDLRNLENLDRSIVKIANGHITGRKVGGPITDKGLKDLRSGLTEDLLINYPAVTKDGRRLKSSTILFRNGKQKPIASICINFDLTDIMSFNMFIQDLFEISEEEKQQGGAAETFQNQIGSTLNLMADKIIRKAGKPVASMDRKDRIEIVRQLEDQGFFLIKGAIKIITSKLNVSKYSIYNYLEQINMDRPDQKFYGG
jgi:predicted transcriptional regulator YheO